MIKIIIVLAILLLGGCASNTLVVQGNSPRTVLLAQWAVQAHKDIFCKEGDQERRSAVVSTKNGRGQTNVRYDCAR